MTQKKNTQFEKGVSGNPAGRPKSAKGKGKPVSRLRSTLNKLKELEPDAISVIERSLLGTTAADSEGDEDNKVPVDKSQVETAKWIISSISSLTRTAIAEEAHKVELLNPPVQETEKKVANGSKVTPISRFSTSFEDE